MAASGFSRLSDRFQAGRLFRDPSGWQGGYLALGVVVSAALIAGFLTPVAQAAEPTKPKKERDWTQVDAWNGLTAPDRISAMVLSQAKDEAVEDLSQRTETSQTFALPDGQWRSDLSTGPEWVPTGGDRTTEEGWKKLNTTLQKRDDGSYAPDAHPGKLVFSGGGEGRVKVATGKNADGDPFQLFLTGTLPEPVVEGDALRYVDVQPGVDLVFFVTATGYEQFFVAKTPQALADSESFKLEFVSPKGGMSKQGDELSVTDKRGNQLAYTGSVQSWDATQDQARVRPVSEMAPAGKPDTDEQPPALANESMPPQTDIVDATTTVTDKKTGVVEIDPADVPVVEDAVFPVVIDPSVNLSLSFDTTVSSEFNVDYSSDTELKIGTYNGGAGKYRSFFNVKVSPIIGTRISKATLSLYAIHSWSCTARSWGVYNAGTTSSSTRWSNMPGLGTQWASTTQTKGYSSACDNGWVTQDVTDLVQAWANASTTTRGMALKAGSETDNTYWKRFYSGNHATGKPKLAVTYNSYPNTAGSVAVNGIIPATSPYYTNSTRPVLSAIVKDPDGGSLRARYTVTVAANGAGVAVKANGTQVASGSRSSYTVPTLANGVSYAVQAWGYDGSLESKTVAFPPWRIVVDTVAPGATTITSPQYTNGEWKDDAPAAVSTAFSAMDAVKFEYKTDGSAVKTIAATISGATGTATVSGLSRTKGGHRVEARAIDRAGNASAWTTFRYGVGSIGISSPATNYKTVDRARVQASAKPATSGVVKPTIYWRASGASNASDYDPVNGSATGWNVVKALPDVAADVDPVVNEIWSAAQTAKDAQKERVPFAIDVQVCFAYTATNSTVCTWNQNEKDHRTIIRVPHAFGDNFPVAGAGPGQVALWTGEFNTSTTDVDVPAYTGSISVSRSYSSFGDVTADSVFGPGWQPSFEGSDAGFAGYEVHDSTDVDGMIAFQDEEGSYLLYQQPGGTLVGQKPGDYQPVDDDTAALGYRLTLTAASGQPKTLTLLDDEGVKTVWERSGGVWNAVSVIEPGANGTTTFQYDSQGRVTRILAPIPAGLTPSDCTDAAFSAGCRAIYISYYTSADTGAGAYDGRVKKIRYRAWDPDQNAVAYQDVTRYTYTGDGLLAAAKDERNGLSESYTYATATSPSGAPLLTSIKPAGLAAWKLDYKPDTAHLLNVSRAAPTAGGADVPMNRYVYDLATQDPATGANTMPAGTPDVNAIVQAWGQSRDPEKVFAVFSAGEMPAGSNPTSSEWKKAQLSFTDALGYEVNAASFGAGDWQFEAAEFDQHGNIVRELDSAATAHLRELSAGQDGAPVEEVEVNSVATINRYNEEIKAEQAITWDGGTINEGDVLVPAGTFVTDSWAPSDLDETGALVRVRTHTDYDQGAPNHGVNPRTGQKFSLPTGAIDTRAAFDTGHWSPEVEVATGETKINETRTGYDPIDSATATSATSGWILGAATTFTQVMESGVSNIVTKTRYDELGRAIESRGPGSNGADPNTTLSFFYTAGANSEAGCGNKPEWAGLSCVSRTGEATPSKPVTKTIGYSMLLQPTTSTETLGGVVRTSTTEYLPDGRIHATELAVAGLSGTTAVERGEIVYDQATALPLASITKNTAGAETGRISNTNDLWGRTTTYADADGAVTTSSYDAAGRLATVVDPRKTVSYTYDGTDAAGREEHRGLSTGMTISGVGNFSAAYDAAGNMTLQKLPGGIIQENEYTLAGTPTELSYYGKDGAGEKAPLLAWSQRTNVEGQVAFESTPTAGQAPGAVAGYNRAYEYDRAGRLIKVEDRTALPGDSVLQPGDTLEPGDTYTPCTTRTYTFDQKGNRLSRSTATSGASGACTTSGSATDTWEYDGADRVKYGKNNTGTYEYDALGRQLILPGIDTPKGASQGNIQIGYYQNDLVHSLSQNGATTTFGLDPIQRRGTSTTVNDGVTTKTTRHYTDASDNPGWATKQVGSGAVETTWYGSSLGGDLGVTVVSSGSTTTTNVQLADLHGDVAMPITIDGTSITNVGGFSDYDEYGQPLTEAKPDTGAVSYGWVGDKERATDESTGLMLMGVRLYNAATGLFTSVDPVPGGNSTDYVYPQDPINVFDLDGKAGKQAGAIPFIPIIIALLIAAARAAAKAAAKAAGKAAAKSAGKAAAKKAKKLAESSKTHTYKDVTNGRSVTNMLTNVTREELARQLRRKGWKSSLSKDGKAQIFKKDGAKWVLREKNSSGHPGWTAEYTPHGKSTATHKYRLEEQL